MNMAPFTPDMSAEAAGLLARRHQRDRLALPELPARFEDPAVSARAIRSLLAKKGAAGFAALHKGRLCAYLLGETIAQPWGRSGYVDMPGYALADGESPALFQDLYAHLGDHWNGRGCFNHYVYLCAADAPAIDAWFNLGFGKERIAALLDLRAVDLPEVTDPPGITIRRVVKGDNAYLAGLSDTIWRQQTRAPRWHPFLPEDAQVHADGWAEIADSETDLAFLAFESPQGGRDTALAGV